MHISKDEQSQCRWNEINERHAGETTVCSSGLAGPGTRSDIQADLGLPRSGLSLSSCKLSTARIDQS